jgi:NAD(P)-dependent dehydrogenase (short-subunit alcohol dehydrogenase family)
MKKEILVIGSSGRLGSSIPETLSVKNWNNINITGVSRKSHVNGYHNSLTCDLFNLASFKAALEKIQDVHHVVYCPMHNCFRGWEEINEQDEQNSFVMNYQCLNWLGKFMKQKAISSDVVRDRSLTILSSYSALAPYDNQTLYGPMKAMSDALFLHLHKNLASHAIRVNNIMPNSFPNNCTPREVAETVINFMESRLSGCHHKMN